MNLELKDSIEITDKKNPINKFPKFIKKLFTKYYIEIGIVYLNNGKPIMLDVHPTNLYMIKWLDKVIVQTTNQKRAERIIFEYLGKKYPKYKSCIQLF